MRIRTKKELDEARKPRYVTITVDKPSGQTVHEVRLDRSEAEEAVEYLRVHNGSAPEFVHAFIDAMEIALAIRV